ncbi:MAG TPA: phosphoribosyltransferase family protein [Micromonosporaceae bacterium]
MQSDEYEAFEDRREAGSALAEKVAACLTELGAADRPLVLGLPRGGLPVAREIADRVGGDLDVAVARKIGLPGQEEFGIGAVTADGPPRFSEDTLRRLGLSEDALAPNVEREREEARRRLHRYRGDREPPRIADRTVIVADDGVATGVTAMAALREVRAKGPRHVIFAAPVCAKESVPQLSGEADRVVCVLIPDYFAAVGAWYRDFAQLTDDDVVAVLEQAWSTRPTG